MHFAPSYLKMSILYFGNIWRLSLVSIIFLQIVQLGSGKEFQFNRNATGVAYSAYVHNKGKEPGGPDWKSYSLQDVKTMMKVISGRFSKVTTFGMGAGSDQYEPNETYYQSFSQVLTGEAAALVNKEMGNGNQNPLSVYLGIWKDNSKTEVSLSLESAVKANSISRDTVQGIVFPIGRTNDTLHTIRHVKENQAYSALKFGIRGDCQAFEALTSPEASPERENLIELLREINFIICEVEARISLGAEGASGPVKAKLEKYKQILKVVNPRAELMGQTGVPAKGRVEVDTMAAFWEEIDKWAVSNNVTMWMLEAFDQPWKNDAGNFGWWKLEDDSKTGVVEGYVEKIKSLSITTKPTNPAPPQGDSGKKQPRSDKPGEKNGCKRQYYATNFIVVALVAFISKMI